MKPSAKVQIHVQGNNVSIYTTNFHDEFISLTDIAKYRSDEPNDVIRNWMRNRETLEFLGLWEKLHNPLFKPVEFDGFKRQAGLHALRCHPKNGLKALMPSVLQSSQAGTTGALMHNLI